MKYFTLLILASFFITVQCSRGHQSGPPANISVGSSDMPVEDALISKGYTGKNSYRIVCKGFPKEGLTGVARVESAKRAALLSAYFFAKSVFDDSVAPDTDGKVEKYEIYGSHAVIYYLIKKSGLRNRVR